MARIEGEIVIARRVDEVLDYPAGQRDEPDYNPRMARSEKGHQRSRRAGHGIPR